MPRKARSASAADRLHVRSCDPLGYLIKQFKDEPTVALALELLPYQCPKLRSVDVKQQSNVAVAITIGGLDGNN